MTTSMATRTKKTQHNSAPVLQPADLQLLSINQTMELLGLGRTKIYDLIKREGLPTTRISGSTRIPLVKLKAWIDARETTQGHNL